MEARLGSGVGLVMNEWGWVDCQSVSQSAVVACALQVRSGQGWAGSWTVVGVWDPSLAEWVEFASVTAVMVMMMMMGDG